MQKWPDFLLNVCKKLLTPKGCSDPQLHYTVCAEILTRALTPTRPLQSQVLISCHLLFYHRILHAISDLEPYARCTADRRSRTPSTAPISPKMLNLKSSTSSRFLTDERNCHGVKNIQNGMPRTSQSDLVECILILGIPLDFVRIWNLWDESFCFSLQRSFHL